MQKLMGGWRLGGGGGLFFSTDPKCLWKKYPQNLHTPKDIYFSENPKNIEIQNFGPRKMTRAYVCIKISEFTPWGVLGDVTGFRDISAPNKLGPWQTRPLTNSAPNKLGPHIFGDRIRPLQTRPPTEIWLRRLASLIIHVNHRFKTIVPIKNTCRKCVLWWI